MKIHREIQTPIAGPYSIRFVKGGPPVPARLEVEDFNDAVGHLWSAIVNMQPIVNEFDGSLILMTGGDLAVIVPLAMLNGELWGAADPPEATMFVRIMAMGDIITEEKYERMVAFRKRAETEAPWHPCLHPYRKVDRTKLPPMGGLAKGIKDGE